MARIQVREETGSVASALVLWMMRKMFERSDADQVRCHRVPLWGRDSHGNCLNRKRLVSLRYPTGRIRCRRIGCPFGGRILPWAEKRIDDGNALSAATTEHFLTIRWSVWIMIRPIAVKCFQQSVCRLRSQFSENSDAVGGTSRSKLSCPLESAFNVEVIIFTRRYL
jgi:hypothetical protein